MNENAVTSDRISESRGLARTKDLHCRLISAVPIEMLAARLTEELSVVTKRAPHSELASCLGSMVTDLKNALHEARNTDVYLTVEELAVRTSIPVSTLRRQCSRFKERVGASKKTGVWLIHWPTFDAYLRSPAVPVNAMAA